MAQTLKESVRQRILQAAEEQMYSEGPSVTMRQIAKAAGLTPGNLYRYYAGREELLRAVIDPVVQGLDALIRRHTGDRLALGQTSFDFPAGEGEKALEELRDMMYGALAPALLDLFQLAGEYPRPMAILCQQNEVNEALMQWFYSLIQRTLDWVLEPDLTDQQLTRALIQAEGQSFCVGITVLMRQCATLSVLEQTAAIHAFLAIHIEGILWLLKAAVRRGQIRYKGEKRQ